MAIGKQNLEAQYAKALQIGKTPQGFSLLKQAALGQNDDFDQIVANMALKALTKEKTAIQGAQAQQQLAQGGKQTVRDRILAEADSSLPEMLGIGRLPAQNMDEMAAAQGGVVGYADGGAVERYEDGGWIQSFPAGRWAANYWDELQAAKKKREEEAVRSLGLMKQASPIGLFVPQTDEERAAAKKELSGIGATPTTPAPAAAPAAAPAVEPVKAPEGVKKALATVAQPKTPVEDPTKAEVANLDKTLASTEKLYAFLDKKFGAQLDPIKAQLEKDREDYKTMKSENVGLALLGAAGALLKPGRSTASAIGEGLSTLGEYGMRFQPQLLAARQGISAGEVGLAQAQAQAARGNFGTAAQLVGQDQTRALQERELAIKEPLYRAQAGYYGAAAGAKSGAGTGLNQLRALQSSIQAELKGLQGKVDPASQDRARLLQQQLSQISQKLASGVGLDLASGFVGGRDATGKAYRSSLFEE